MLPPDINQSQLRFTVEPDQGVRFGLTAIKNVGEGAIESLLGVRAKQGRHHVARLALRGSRSAARQQARVREPDQGRRVRLARAKAPATKALPTLQLRPRILAAVDAACEHGARAQRDREQGQGGCSGRARTRPRAAAGAQPGFTLPEAAPWTETEQLGFEKETLGLYWSGHPVDRYADALKAVRREDRRRSRRGAAGARRAATPGGRAAASRWRPTPRVGGIVAACRQLKTRKGDRMAVFTLEDALGGVEIVVFPEAYRARRR